jgi:chemotaxis protein CheZ
MADPRKVFRIEETAAFRTEPRSNVRPAPELAEIMHELGALRALLANTPSPPPGKAGGALQDEIDRLAAELRSVRAAIAGTKPVGGNVSPEPLTPATQIISELEATTCASEQAAQKILAAAEDIDQAANNLSAALKSDSEQGLAQDIRDRVIQIFEACNYQDLTSQRVVKVTTALGRIERQIARALNEPVRAEAAPPAHGPRLPHDRGHVSQNDVDAMFSAAAKSA